MARVAALLLFAVALRAQSVEGALTDSVTHAPVTGIPVSLVGATTYTAITDNAGGFQIPSMQPGRYSFAITTNDYRMPVEARLPVEVGDSAVKLSFALQPLCRITGRVVFPDGRPASGAPITLGSQSGGLTLTLGTDARGNFQIGGLDSGKYVLRAGPPRGTPTQPGELWAPTWFPNALERSAAEPVRLRPGASLSGYEIRLRSVPAFHVRGTVRDDTGKPAPRATVMLVRDEPNAGAEQTVESDAAGAFDLLVYRGEWTVAASLKREVELKAAVSATVSRHDLDRIDIRLARPFALPVLHNYPGPQNSGVTLRAVGAAYEMHAAAVARPDGDLVVQNVYPGTYRVRPISSPPGYYLAAILLGDRDVFGKTVEIYDGSTPLRLRYESGAPRLVGTIENGEGAAVIIVPQDELVRNVEFLRTVTAGPGGRFEAGNLRPGDYWAFAFDRVETRDFLEPSFLRELIPHAVPFHVEKGETASVDLKVTKWPE